MDNMGRSKKQSDTEPVVGSATWGWVVFVVLTAAILAAAYFLKP
ncbi:MAG TPA: hypothetical protein VNS34_28345 [Rhizobiaceae bacterium]|nr:hypothetical protein [Rhizobiaceae bacterium]